MGVCTGVCEKKESTVKRDGKLVTYTVGLLFAYESFTQHLRSC